MLSSPGKNIGSTEVVINDEAYSLKSASKDISPLIRSIPEKPATLPEKKLEPEIALVNPEKKNTALKEDKKVDPVNNEVPVASFAEAKNENRIFYINEDVLKRSKLGGFFKKVKKFAEQTANLKKGHTKALWKDAAEGILWA